MRVSKRSSTKTPSFQTQCYRTQMHWIRWSRRTRDIRHPETFRTCFRYLHNGYAHSARICPGMAALRWRLALASFRTTENYFLLVYFLTRFCPYSEGYSMFRTCFRILHNAYARSARIRPCMRRIRWRLLSAVRSATLIVRITENTKIFVYFLKRFPHTRQPTLCVVLAPNYCRLGYRW